MDGDSLLESGLRSYDEHDWAEAYRLLSAASAQTALPPEHVVRLGTAAYLVGRDDELDQHFGDAFRRAVDSGDRETAVRAAFWAAFALGNSGESARAHGWAERGRRLVEAAGAHASPRERCSADLIEALLAVRADQPGIAPRLVEIASWAAALGEPDLEALALMGEGYSLVLDGDVRHGMRRLDEVMVAVTAGEIHPMAAGLIYCVVLEACTATLDLRRSAEWTTALTRWCEAQPGLVPYRGQCLVHRVQVMQLRGSWNDATEEAERACGWLSQPPQPAVGAAVYEWGELHRLRGDLAEAEQKYAEASRWGHDPQPGLALLRLAQGRPDAAVTGLRRSLVEANGSSTAPTVLAAYVEALLACGDRTGAVQAAADLQTAAVDLEVPMAGALAAQARARVALASGEPAAALRDGRRAWTLWHELDAPYHAARSRVVVGEACLALGDEDAARMELEAARAAFEQLDARLDLRRTVSLLAPEAATTDTCPLTLREREVIRLIAEGLTNRAIATELFVSEKTVARHLSNIFTKIEVTTRTAAARYAYAHGLA